MLLVGIPPENRCVSESVASDTPSSVLLSRQTFVTRPGLNSAAPISGDAPINVKSLLRGFGVQTADTTIMSHSVSKGMLL